jgi:hypothetical protein
MPKYRQYTKCVDAKNFRSSKIIEAVAAGMFVALLAIVIIIAATGGLGGVAGGGAAALGLVTGLLSFCHWWLYGRLICLGGERCAIGMVISVEPPSEKKTIPESWEPFSRLDSDYSFNLLLPPLLPGASQAEVIAKGIDGYLIAEQPATSSMFLPFRGAGASTCDARKCAGIPEKSGYLEPFFTSSAPIATPYWPACPHTEALHCEFEGAGIYILYQWLKVIFGILVAGTVLGALCFIPIIGWIACAIGAALLAIAAAAFIAAIVHGNLDAASPSDVDPALGGEMKQNDCSGLGADLVVVSGEWVYDSLHDGWNEIHPIRQCQKIGTWTGTWPWADPKAERDAWCGALAAARSPLTVDNQKKPENQWGIHPSVDGCKPEGNDNNDPIIK